MMNIFKIFLFVIVSLLFIHSVSSPTYAQEDSITSQHQLYLEAIKRAEEKEAEARARGEVKPPIPKIERKQEPTKERMCLETASCRPVDFSSEGTTTRNLIQYCRAYMNGDKQRESSGELSDKLSDDARTCFLILLSSVEMMGLQTFIQAKEAGKIYTWDQVKGIKADRSNCPFAVSETFPELYVDFMERNPDLLNKNFSYTIYLFYKDITECTVYSGKIQKK